MPTIRNVADRAGVSVGTVSNVLSGRDSVDQVLRKRVEQAMRELDYHPSHAAQSLKSRRTSTIGMVIPDISNPFFPQLVRGAEEAAFKRGYLLAVCNTDDKPERERQITSVLRSGRVDGLIIVAAPDGDKDHLIAARNSNLPVVCLDRVPPGIKVDSVTVDNVRGASMAVRHLLQLGHRQVAVLTGNLALQNARERLAGYEAAMREWHLKPAPELKVQGDYHEETGYRLGKQLLLRRKRPTALFVCNGMMTLGVLHAMNELGLTCPKDLAIVSFDELPLAGPLRPQITAVAQPTYEMAQRSTELLIQRIESRSNGGSRVSIILEPDLRIRESTSGMVVPYAAASD